MIVAGIGCRKGVSADEIEAALAAAVAAAGIAPGSLSAIATGGIKANEPGIPECAARRKMEFIVVDDEALKKADARCLTRSEASLKAAGVGSLCEAAALAAAGTGGLLLGPRLVVGGVTCALAREADTAAERPPLRLGGASTPRIKSGAGSLPRFAGARKGERR